MYELFRLVDYQVCVKLVDGDRAATLSESQMVQRATGRTIRSRIAGFHRFSDGRLIEYRGFVDSFDAVEQVLGRELTP
jgi:ketosteroid isomerase-like protein